MKNRRIPQNPHAEYFSREQGARPIYSGTNTKTAGNTALKKRRKGKGFKKFAVTVICLALIISLAAAGFIWLKLDKINYVTPQEISREMGVEFDTSLENYESMSGGIIQTADGELFSQKDVINILILGTDERTQEFSDARSDSMMILSINKKKNTWAVVSLERAMAVLIPGRSPDWLTHTFSYGGPELVLATVRSHLKIDIDRYVRVNFSAFETIIDALGGIDISITDTEAIYLNTMCGGSFGIGEQHLNGEFALQYARMRKPDSDWQRVQRQRNVIAVVAQKIKQLNIFQLNSLANEVLPLVQTNLTKPEMFSIILHAPFLLHKEMRQATIPLEGTYSAYTDETGKSMYIADFNANAEALRRIISGEEE